MSLIVRKKKHELTKADQAMRKARICRQWTHEDLRPIRIRRHVAERRRDMEIGMYVGMLTQKSPVRVTLAQRLPEALPKPFALAG